MDLIRQNKFISWVIVILVVLNLSTLSMVWMQSNRNNQPPLKDSDPQGNPVNLMRREIGLSDDQVKKYERMRQEHMGKIKEINDALDNSKLRIADEIFAATPDEKKVDSIAAIIGMLQAKVEVMRFEHFRDLVKICNAEQKEKLHPILSAVFGKKGPNEGPEIKFRGERRLKPEDIKGSDRRDEQRPPRQDERTGPPSLEDKVNRYAERLSLTGEQIIKVKEVISTVERKKEDIKSKLKPGEQLSETDRNKMLKEEDESILKILNPEQKKEFEKMIMNRGKR